MIARGSHSFTCHPLTNHTCLYSPATGHHRPLPGTHYFILRLHPSAFLRLTQYRCVTDRQTDRPTRDRCAISYTSYIGAYSLAAYDDSVAFSHSATYRQRINNILSARVFSLSRILVAPFFYFEIRSKYYNSFIFYTFDSFFVLCFHFCCIL